MTLCQSIGVPVITARLYDGTRWNGVCHYSHAATPDGRHIDVTRLALEVLTLDAMRLGRPRARSGAEKVLRKAGFAEPSRMYAFAMDHKIRHDRASESMSLVGGGS